MPRYRRRAEEVEAREIAHPNGDVEWEVSWDRDGRKDGYYLEPSDFHYRYEPIPSGLSPEEQLEKADELAAAAQEVVDRGMDRLLAALADYLKSRGK